MKPEEIIRLKLESPNTLLYDKHKNTTHTVEWCFTLMMLNQLIARKAEEFAERFEVENG